jgi:hypothetical protein
MSQEGRRERALGWFNEGGKIGQEKGEEKNEYSELGRGKRETVSRGQEKKERRWGRSKG